MSGDVSLAIASNTYYWQGEIIKVVWHPLAEEFLMLVPG
jgi:hypothetical protein